MAHAGRTLLPPRAWSISARSALVSATVILMALTVAGAILLSVLYFSLISAADNAAASRLRDITKTLQSETPDIDPPLLATDQRIVAVQILDGAGHSVASSSSTPEPPMLALNAIERTPRIGITGAAVRMHEVRVAAQALETPSGRYLVLVGAGTED